jgi:UDPglucose--hexose-1-phosphate uridylyltransferase
MSKYISELRQDPVSKEWVVIATSRRFRPHQVKLRKQRRVPKKDCPFENPQSAGNKAPVLMLDRYGKRILPNFKKNISDNWFLQIIPNKFPIIKGEKCGVEKKRGIFVTQEASGFHEVVIYKDHYKDPSKFSAEELEVMFLGYQERYRMLIIEPCVEYILIFHNHGSEAGASIYHPHSQIVTLPVIPPDVGRSISGSKAYFEKYNSCIHCEMIFQELKAKKRVVYENEEMIAICPYASKVSFETRIFPKRHEYAFEHIEQRQRKYLADAFRAVFFAINNVLNYPSYNFFLHTAPSGPEYFSHYHWHFEILPRSSIWAGVELGTGIEVVAVAPEDAAQHLKKALKSFK